MLERGVLQSERERAFALVLGLFDSTITYRSLYQRRQELAALLDLLVFDEDNPRALATMVGVLRTEVARLPDTGAGPASALLARLPAGRSRRHARASSSRRDDDRASRPPRSQLTQPARRVRAPAVDRHRAALLQHRRRPVADVAR